MQSLETRALRPGLPARPARRVAAAAFTPYVPPPPAPLPAASQSELVFQLPQASPAAFPSLPTAPSIATELIDERATAPHWGSRALEEALSAAGAALQAQTPSGSGQLADALRDLQATLSDNVRKLDALSQQAGALPGQLGAAASGDVQQGLAVVSEQLQRVAAAAQAASAATSFEPPAAPAAVLPSAGAAASSADLSSQLSQLGSAQYAGYSLQTLALITAGVAALIALSVPRQRDDDDQAGGSGSSSRSSGNVLSSGSGGSGSAGDALPTRWDAAAVDAYYRRRPALVARRVLEVAAEALGYGTALLADMAAGNVDRNMAERADQAMGAIERLGPAYVKVAQALSTRVDLLPPAYLVAIQRLQDRVPPFPDAVAYACIERSFGRPLGEVFSSLSDSAVAAASLGQVYKGTLRATGEEVAIKVRRPGVLESVTLDLHLMRQVAIQLREVPQVRSDWVGIIDEWAARFLDEMNYRLEADNTRQFQRDLGGLAGIVIPDVIEEGTSSDVLVLSWVEGERLTDSKASDVRQLCDTLLSAYLIQLLDTGFLHADPHPGNLLRTPDGRVGILDHGLVTVIPREYTLALLEYIAHLSVADWDSLIDDLVALGFVDSVEDRESLVGPLGAILTQLSAGGGARKVNVAVVMEEIERMTARYEFRVPPYFALILRTFSVIEGIALQADPDYSIVKECLPYLARRLLTDDSPRARHALKEILFGRGDQLSLERFELLLRGVQSFTVDGLTDGASSGSPAAPAQQQAQLPAGAAGQQVQQQQQAPRPLINATAKEVLAAVFSTRPTYVQELLVNEAVGTVDAAGRQLAAMLLSPALGNLAAAQAAMQQGSGAGVPGSLLPAPLAVLTKLPSLVELSPADQQQLRTAQAITTLLLQQQAAAPAPGAQLTLQQAAALAQQLATELGPLLPQLLPGVAATGQLFVEELGKRTADRLAAVVGEGLARGQEDAGYRAPMDL
ncbi:hypothetical protein ABPG75_013064 [Micractinium tetrahymenae]